MAKTLFEMTINRVDLVGKGANPDAHIMLFKSDDVAKRDIMNPNPKDQAWNDLLTDFEDWKNTTYDLPRNFSIISREQQLCQYLQTNRGRKQYMTYVDTDPRGPAVNPQTNIGVTPDDAQFARSAKSQAFIGIDLLAQRFKKANPGTTLEACYVKVLTTPEGAELYSISDFPGAERDMLQLEKSNNPLHRRLMDALKAAENAAI
ncbi:MAG: hypothetical protein AB1500_07680 [Bacillota bacterium]